jgi:hypothetical protein
MTDLYLKTLTEEDMNAALIEAGIVTEQTVETQVGETEDGDAILQDVTVLVPTQGVSLDVIGPIVRVTGYDEDGEPITVEYPEWHVNVRCGGLTDEQLALIEPIQIIPPEQPYRVWA